MCIYCTKLGKKYIMEFFSFECQTTLHRDSKWKCILSITVNLKKKCTNVQPLYAFDLVIFYVNNNLSRRYRCTVIYV